MCSVQFYRRAFYILWISALLFGTGIVNTASCQDGKIGPLPTIPRKPSCATQRLSADLVSQAIDAAHSLPQPLTTDALIQIADKISTACPDFSRNLLMQAFEQAGSIKEETAHKTVATLMDSRLAMSARASELAMDRLSIRSRIVVALASLSPRDATVLFRSIPTPRPDVTGCATLDVPDVSPYYSALGKILVLVRTRDAQSPYNSLTMSQLEEIVSSTTSPVQIPLLAQVLQKAELKQADFESFVTILASRIESFPVDNRSLSYAGPGVVDAVIKLAYFSQSSSGMSHYSLVHSFYNYLNRSLHGIHCADTVPREPNTLPRVFDAFNQKLANAAIGIPALEFPKPSLKVEPRGKEFPYWRSKKAQDLLTDAKRINFDDQWVAYTNRASTSSEWQERAQHLLNEIYSWTSNDESDIGDYYHQRCILLRTMLAKISPRNSIYDTVVQALVNTFENSVLQTELPNEWYVEIIPLLQNTKRPGGHAAPEVLSALAQSRNRYLNSLSLLTRILE